MLCILITQVGCLKVIARDGEKERCYPVFKGELDFIYMLVIVGMICRSQQRRSQHLMSNMYPS